MVDPFTTVSRSCGTGLLVLILSVVFTSGCQSNASQTVVRPKQLQFKSKTWVRIQREDPRKSSDFTLEYVPQGQSKSNWQELLTNQFFAAPPDSASPTAILSAAKFSTIYERKLRETQKITTFQSIKERNQARIYWSGIVADSGRKPLANSKPAQSKAQDSAGRWHFQNSPNDFAGQLKESLWNSKTPVLVKRLRNQESCMVLAADTNDGLQIWQYARRHKPADETEGSPAQNFPTRPWSEREIDQTFQQLERLPW